MEGTAWVSQAKYEVGHLPYTMYKNKSIKILGKTFHDIGFVNDFFRYGTQSKGDKVNFLILVSRVHFFFYPKSPVSL